MEVKSLEIFKCPVSKTDLHLEKGDRGKDILISNEKKEYPVIDGIPDFTLRNNKEEEKREYARDLFRQKAKTYDEYQHLSFETFYKDENEVRNSLIDRLQLKQDSKVLEVNAGTGRDSVLISKRLSKEGLLHVQDISREMLEVCQEKLSQVEIPTEMHQGDASRLPYADNTFDAVYSFGGVGMNTYSNNKEAIAELVRVTKVGGRIVFGGLSLGPWLKSTLFGKVLINHNNHYANEINFQDLPIEARNLNVQWILEGAGFVVDFTVGEGEPSANLTYEIPGARGGTHMTRYFGKLEGVTPETKELAIRAREKLGISMHKWLDELIKKEADRILKEED